MTVTIIILSFLLGLVGALGPGLLFLIPRLDPGIWYRLGVNRTMMVVSGSVVLLAAYWMDRERVWALPMVLVLIGLRLFLRPDRVIRAMEAPRRLPASEADLPPDSLVLTVAVDGEAHAWPVPVVIAHHLVHDWIGESPVLASW